MGLTELPRVEPMPLGRPDLPDVARPMQELTRAIATARDAWTPERVKQMTALADAVARGGLFPTGWCVEVGSGTGNTTGDLRAAFHDVVSLDLSREMLRLAFVTGRQVQSDASTLPIRTGSASVVALVNMFLFPDEITRALADDGVLLWVSTNGEQTPIFLPPAEVLDALPGAWEATTSEAGWGTWLTARRHRS